MTEKESLTIEKNSNLKDALLNIEENGKGIVLVKEKQRFVGLLTDGDIRRAVLDGANLKTPIDSIVNHHPKVAKEEDSFEEILSQINETVKHIPVLNNKGELKKLISVPVVKRNLISFNPDNLLIGINDTLKDAMLVNEEGGMGMVFIIGPQKKFLGLLTDGDIRRAILKGNSLTVPVKKFLTKNITINEKSTFKEINDLISDEIKMLPVLDDSGRLVKILTAPVAVILPTYNEKGNINRLISKISEKLSENKIGFDITVIDDDSEDGTAEEVKKSNNNNTVNLIVRKNEKGLASAIKTGIKNSFGDVLIFMDTDFNHNPKDIPRLLEHCDQYDIVNGSRFIKGGGMEGAKLRWVASLFFNKFCSLFLGLKTKDNQSGFIAIKKSTLDKFNYDEIFSGYGDYAIRLFYLAKKKNLKIKEIPVIYSKRTSGESKTRFVKHTIQYLKTILNLKGGI